MTEREQTNALIVELEELLSRARVTNSTLERLLQERREEGQAVQAEKLTVESQGFGRRADSHSGAGGWWLRANLAAILSLAVYTYLVWVRWSPTISSDEWFETVQGNIPRLLGLATAGYLLTLTSRNYNRHRHNEVVNRTRQNSLEALPDILAGVEAPEARDIIVIEAMRSIFRSEATGYASVTPDLSSGSGEGISAASALRSVAGGARKQT